jgi:hypothetical protein
MQQKNATFRDEQIATLSILDERVFPSIPDLFKQHFYIDDVCQENAFAKNWLYCFLLTNSTYQTAR